MAVEPFLGTRAQRFFILTVTIQALVVLAMVGCTFGFVIEQVGTEGYQTLSCFLALFALGEIFELLMAFDALRARNVIQLGGILLFHLALLVSAALQVDQTQGALAGHLDLWRKVRPFVITAPCVIGLSWLCMMFWIRQLYNEFGWAIFHVVGANPRMKTMYQFYQVMICLLKFDFFFFTGVTMQLIIVILDTSSAEFGITVAAIPIVLILLVLCGIAVQREIKWIMTISLIMMLAAESYLYKLVRFFQPDNVETYATTRATLATFTIMAFILLFATFGIGLRCFSDFDQGLQASKVNDVPARPKYSQHSSSATHNMGERQSSYMAGGPLTPRISIE